MIIMITAIIVITVTINLDNDAYNDRDIEDVHDDTNDIHYNCYFCHHYSYLEKEKYGNNEL